ncbi:MAG: type II toxin-antitoxin system PemK/MazF family toxin [Candidatus Nomurabacteria bacterium]|jgi:mRNA interferase MazF|nr:type II toxin-antitoxin system PemK/MazF family toxin [Candidatus Nomurabacteria bacterium]
MKNYENWTPVKASLNSGKRMPSYREGNVYWASIGENIGFEQDGKGRAYTRPVLILRGFSAELVLGLPLSSQKKSGRYFLPIVLNGEDGVLLLSQIRAIDTLRLGDKIGQVDRQMLKLIKAAVAKMILQ